MKIKVRRYKASLGPNMFRRFRTRKIENRIKFKRSREKIRFRKELEQYR